MKLVDLFAGTGAFSYAFQKHEVVPVFSNDMLESSRAIYDMNFQEHKLTLQNLCDVDVNDIPTHDILTGGFPCQPFSIAGRREGFNDPRSNVFWKILDILDKHHPSIVVLENVKNLTSHDNGNTFKVIIEELESRGYHVRYKVLNTAKITGIPQHRERIYIVALLNKDLYDQFTLDFPEKEKKRISELLDSEVPAKYYYTEKSGAWNLLKDVDMKPDTVYQYRRVYVRENKSGECPTLTANMGSGGHNVPIVRDHKGIRKLTPRECFRFQGFPDSYALPELSDAKLYSLAGNAVSVPVVELIADRLMKMSSKDPR